MGSVQENISLISAKLREIQDASIRRSHVVFVADEERNYYAQFRCDGSESLFYGELVSNAFLDDPWRLEQGQINQLLQRGWGLGDKNFYKTWSVDDDPGREEIAQETMSALIDVYKVPVEASLTSKVTLGGDTARPLLSVDFASREASSAEELAADMLTDEELDAIIEREQAEADAAYPVRDHEKAAPAVNIDADQRNADWLKTLSWDLPTELDAFLSAIGGRSQLDSFMSLPAAEAMPQQLASQLGVIVPASPADKGDAAND